MENGSGRLQQLFRQYLDNNISEAEFRELWQLLRQEPHPPAPGGQQQEQLGSQLQELWEAAARAPLQAPPNLRQQLRQAMEGHPPYSGDTPQRQGRRHIVMLQRISAAVITVLLLAAAYLLVRTNFRSHRTATVQQPGKSIAPGGNKAVLVLGNGSTIVLDSAGNGEIGRQGGARIVKQQNGLLAYQATRGPHEPVYNTLRTPRGGQYRLTLPDGSAVWLNAASSIRFPVTFTGTERRVEITGEAYFEVAKDAARPFRVTAGALQVDVLGTHFNINAYEPAGIQTTLLEGAVKVSRGASTLLLQPLQQARTGAGGALQLVKDADAQQAVAWKNGLFWFEDADIAEVMRQLSRWYDADIVVNGHITQRFTGTIPRNVPVSEVFAVLQETGSLHYSITGRKIIVSP